MFRLYRTKSDSDTNPHPDTRRESYTSHREP